MLANKVCLVTGGYGGIGKAIALMLAKEGAHVTILGRDATKCTDAVQELKSESGNEYVSGKAVDLSLKSAIQSYTKEVRESGSKVDVLVNNVVCAPKKRQTTSEGIEVQLATNVLGYIWMTEGLEEAFNTGARVVNVASNYAGDLDVNDLQFVTRRYDNNTAYRQSKQANRMISTYLASKFADKGILVFSCHPGVVTTHLSSDLGFSGFESAESAADTPFWLASSADLSEQHSGKYFQGRSLKKCNFSSKIGRCQELYNKCMEISDSVDNGTSEESKGKLYQG
jgi:NAD(P)-dependent dehydrogenase (short-subunit alcohol dehydrogenase family)